MLLSKVSAIVNIQPAAIIDAIATHTTIKTAVPNDVRPSNRTDMTESQFSATSRRSRSLSFAALRGGADNKTGSWRRRISRRPSSSSRWSRADVTLGSPSHADCYADFAHRQHITASAKCTRNSVVPSARHWKARQRSTDNDRFGPISPLSRRYQRGIPNRYGRTEICRLAP